ncbi:MAG: glycoside hydrolase family 3 protein [Pseudonocardia sp.]|uniref:glycoside hydrolase family 3 N-terminal domain-containing protein n=1 Tax=unclassified Pseudonocardia TaxID=2619320 RepID=UPI0008697CB1|nr:MULTISPECIES: glycoside hydrolase family 3 N-terminal domain-containing protein [unclassified Pseudonocardia]MBN9109182.1 glycoside hydrolase family 3 protein [Pseudonocardia sp.]ODU25295.1 MAG: beta-glucosidase [Pseudonocardia sp. SCN 72-51]ODV01475.1 MAG: beta-glucosidase [Pseudonocardia sp. SCN 73-27]
MSSRRKPRSLRTVVPVLVGLIAGSVLAGVGVAATGAGGGPSLTSQVESTTPSPSAGAAPSAEGPAVDTCAPMVAAMSTRDRLAQRVMIGVDPAGPASVVATVRSSHVGGIFVGGNATALLQNDALAAVQKASPVPVAVAVDDEGGRVQRIDALDGSLPSARTMAGTKTPEQVRAIAKKRAEQLKARGVTIDFAPDADVSDQPADAVIGDRSFSNDPAVVTKYAQAFAQGLEDGGIVGTLKHFPGHGHSTGDSHKGRVSVPPLDQLRRADLLPYRDLVGPGKPLYGTKIAVMVGHLDVPGLTTDLPSSLTPAVYQLLRDQYGFDGMVVTDDLGAMKAISAQFTVPQATVRALAAGADMALSSDITSPGPVLDALEKALADGTISAADNDAAVARILTNKGLCG